MATGLPVSSTTMVLGFADATASITASWPHGSDRSGRSKPSPSTRIPKTTTTSERPASSAASAGVIPGSNSICASGMSLPSSCIGDDGSRYRLRMLPMIPGPPMWTSAA